MWDGLDGQKHIILLPHEYQQVVFCYHQKIKFLYFVTMVKNMIFFFALDTIHAQMID